MQKNVHRVLYTYLVRKGGYAMSRVENKKIADETRRITEQGYYELDGKHITLEYGMIFIM